MDFRPLDDTKRKELLQALRGNAENGTALLLDRRDTSFRGMSDDVPDEEVLNSVRSIPCHY